MRSLGILTLPSLLQSELASQITLDNTQNIKVPGTVITSHFTEYAKNQLEFTYPERTQA